MHSTTLLLLLAPLLTASAPTPDPNPKLGPSKPTSIDITLYDTPSCKGESHKFEKAAINDVFKTNFAQNSYHLSEGLGENDYLKFESMRPFVPLEDDRKEGCHDLPEEAFWFSFYDMGENVEEKYKKLKED